MGLQEIKRRIKAAQKNEQTVDQPETSGNAEKRDELLDEIDEILEDIDEVLDNCQRADLGTCDTCPCGMPFEACYTWVGKGLYRAHDGDLWYGNY